MKYVSCLLLESGMAFSTTAVKPCNPGSEIYWVREYHGEPFDVDKFIETRNHYVEMMKKGEIPHQCVGCSQLQEKEWPDEIGIDYIAIASETKCSCNCYYCRFSQDKKKWNSHKGYDVMPILRALNDRKLLRETTFDIVGGECTEYPKEELEEFIKFAVENRCWLHFFTSGIFYSESIAYAMNKSRANIVVSVDSGTKETYEKIKRVKAYDQVWENMARYQSESIKDKFCRKGYVILKYIIIPGVNDSLEELKCFAQKAKEVGCEWVWISVEYNWWNENKDNPMPENLWEVLDYFESCKKDFEIEYVENAIYLWRKRMTQDKNFTGQNPCCDMNAC